MNTERPSSGMLTVPEVAEQLRVKPQTAYRWVREGSLPSVRVAGTIRIPALLLVDRLQRSTVAKPPRSTR